MGRINITSHARWESLVGYSRAVRIGNHVWVAGTTAWNERGEIIGIGDPYVQSRKTLDNIQAALIAAGAGLQDVVRTRMYVTNLALCWDGVTQAHLEVFGDVRPVSTMVEVTRLTTTDMLVEIEVDAFIDQEPSGP